MSADEIQVLYEAGLEAAQSGDNETAADLFKQVVAQDAENADAWLALAAVTEDPVEKRLALTNVTMLDPDNAEAKAQLEALDQTETKSPLDEDWRPGITRREIRTVVFGLSVFTLLSCGLTLVILVLVLGGRQAQLNEVAQQFSFQTATRFGIETSDARLAITQTHAVTLAAATRFAIESPTPTATITPVISPIPSDTPSPTPPPPVIYDGPPDLPGTIYAWGGRNLQSRDYLPIRAYSLSEQSVYERIGDDQLFARSINAPDTGSPLIFSRFVGQTAVTSVIASLDVATVPVGIPETLNNDFVTLDVFDAVQPAISGDGNHLVFVGRSNATGSTEVFYLNLPRSQAVRITNDPDADFRNPTLSSDGLVMIVVRDHTSDGVDLVRYDLANLATYIGSLVGSQTGNQGDEGDVGVPFGEEATPLPPAADVLTRTFLTQDGNAVLENFPVLSPDGLQMAYAQAVGETPDTHDLYLMTLAPDGAPIDTLPVFNSEDDDIHPIFSPDGRYLAFSSNPFALNNNYNIFIREIGSATVYQVSVETDGNVFPGAWVASVPGEGADPAP